MNKIIRYKFIILLMVSIGLFSCKWEKIEPATELPENVSFKTDLEPLFNQSCNSMGCHSANAVPPDLSPGNAYNDITTRAGMIDLDNPENSIMYTRMIDAASPMPPSGVMGYESRQMLSWIKDGAKNN